MPPLPAHHCFTAPHPTQPPPSNPSHPARHCLPHARSTNSLTGTLDPGLGRAWPLIEELGLSGNLLRGTIPPRFAEMGSSLDWLAL